MDLFYFDIETNGRTYTFQDFKENDEVGSNIFLKKFKNSNWEEKYKSDIWATNDFTIENAWKDNSPLLSTFGMINCISFGIETDSKRIIKTINGMPEKDMLIQFCDVLERASKKNITLCGWYIWSFDIPFLLHRLHAHSIKIPTLIDVKNKKPWDVRILDLVEYWRQKSNQYYSLEEICYELGVSIPKGTMTGNQVHTKYWNGSFEEIKEYCEMDVNSTMDVGKRIF